MPVVSFTDRRLRALYRAGITPQTLIVDAEGKVSYARVGALTEAAAIDSVLVGVTAAMSEVTENRPNPGAVR